MHRQPTKTKRKASCSSEMVVECAVLVSDFRFVTAFKALILDSLDLPSETRPGTLLKMLLSQLEGSNDLQKTIFDHYVPLENHPSLYASSLLNLTRNEQKQVANLPLHDLVTMLSKRRTNFRQHSKSQIKRAERWVKVKST